MKKQHKKFLKKLKKAFKKGEDLRIGQVLFNMNVNQFADEINPDAKNHLLRDIYNDTDDKILKRIKK